MGRTDLQPAAAASKLTGVLEPWQSGSALTDLLSVAEPWEEQSEMAGAALVRVAVISSLASLVSGLMLLLLGDRIASAGHGFAHFFWIGNVGRWFVGVVGSLHVLWPFLTATGLLGLLLAAVLVSRPAGPGLRYAVLPVLAMATIGCGPELFLAALFLLQLVLWLLLVAAGIALIVVIIAGLASP
jgi:hypothetical protein